MLQSDQQKVAHLLRRFGLGASEAEVAYYGERGLTGAVDKLLSYEDVDEGFSVDPMSFAVQKNGKLKIEGVQEWWLMRLIATRRPLQEKMTLFWHDHFATSSDKVSSPNLMLTQNEILRAGATGKFKDLLLNVGKDPAMLLWLDNQYNVKGQPNENFAREVMELFTLGIGHYTENDVQEAARAFTGWSFGSRGRRQAKGQKLAKNQSFVDRADQHDDGPKAFLGNQGKFDGDDIVGILCGSPQTARYLTWKLWEWFGYANPEPELIERLSQPFFRNGLRVRELLRDIMLAPEFYSAKAYRSIYKNPIDFIVSTLRQLGFGADALTDENFQTDRRPATAARISAKGMGMNLLYPPDVSGWDGGPSWVSTATMVERIRWAQILFEQAEVGLKNRRFTIGANAVALFEGDPSAEGIAKRLTSVFDANLPEERTANLVAAVKTAMGSGLSASNANETACAATRLIFAAPEFQFS
jgi:uncharacterized protein (DUF1800 family)